MTLQEFRDMLMAAFDCPVYHFEAFPEGKDRYIVWQETEIKSLFGSDEGDERVWAITVLLYTGWEFDEAVFELMALMDEACIAYQDPQIIWDSERKMIRYAINCEVGCSGADED